MHCLQSKAYLFTVLNALCSINVVNFRIVKFIIFFFIDFSCTHVSISLIIPSIKIIKQVSFFENL